MEAKKTKNFKDLMKVADGCVERGDTMLSIYSANGCDSKNNSAILFVGDEKAVASGFARIILESVKDNPDETYVKLGNAFLNAICKVLSMHDKTSDRFADALILAIEHAERKYSLASAVMEAFEYACKDFEKNFKK